MSYSRHILLALVLSITLSGCFKTRAEIAREKEEKEVRSNLQQNIVEYGGVIDRVQADIGRLSGKVEELEHQRKKEYGALSSGRDSTEKSLNELRLKLDELQKGQSALFEEMKKLKEENLQLTKTLSERPKASSGSTPQKKSANASYSEGIKAYNSKKYAVAEKAFRSYLETSPKGKQETDAHFYLGDSLFRQKEYEEAVLQFSVVHEKAPISRLGRKSTLRIAESFKAMGKMKDAKAFAQVLVDQSPNSTEAKQARKILR